MGKISVFTTKQRAEWWIKHLQRFLKKLKVTFKTNDEYSCFEKGCPTEKH